ncbi:MAG: rhodanese-like domain-containing protein [Saprospiraceae bacterium]|nr:rhodanese-like domain-containing protein [Saprospiraceae bacterium]
MVLINCTNPSTSSEASEPDTSQVENKDKSKQKATGKSEINTNLSSGTITLEQAKAMLDSGNFQFIDLRTPEEIAETGKVPGAKELNMRDVEFKNNFQRLDGRTPIVFYCKSGGRSTRAMKMATDLQFSRVYDMKDGMDGWSKKYATN